MISTEKLNRIKIIVSDLDGTLLDANASVGNNIKKLIKELNDYGIQFTIASGRLYSAMISFITELNINIPIISLDGSLIKSYLKDEVLFESLIKEKYVKKAVMYADKFLLNIALCHSDTIYYTEHNSVIPKIMDKFGAKYEEVSSYDNFCSKTLEVVLVSDNSNNLKYVRSKMSFPYSWELSTSYFKSQNYNSIHYLEIRNRGTSKGKGFLKLLKALKIKENEAAVIGDWHNDISLFETAALKVAVANAVPELKRKADFVTQKSNNDNGIEEFLEMVLQSKRDNR